MLTTASTGLQRFQQKNVRIDKHRNILKSVGLVEEGRKVPAEAVECLYDEYINHSGSIRPAAWSKEKHHGPQDLPLYIYIKEGKLQAYIVPDQLPRALGPDSGLPGARERRFHCCRFYRLQTFRNPRPGRGNRKYLVSEKLGG